jgi:light-regulated signal transduction histidine kinase (bacteriophytochrome)
MGELIDDLLGFAELGRQELLSQRIELGALLREIAGDLSGSYPATKVEIGPLPVVVADRSMLRRAFVNLVGNAFKFSERTPEPRVAVSAEWMHREVVICVADNGVGFDMRYAKKLFGVFQQLHGPNEFEGTGIGLAIVQRVAERHGGRVWAEAQPGSGARFYFALPAEPTPRVGAPAS